MKSGPIPPFRHWPTWLQASINQQRKEATWALLQMWQRTPVGCSSLKPRPPPGPCPSYGIKGHWKVTAQIHLQGSRYPPLVLNRSPLTQLCSSSLDSPLRTGGFQGPMTLINSTEPRVTLTVTDKLISFLIDMGTTYSAMTAYSGKPRSLNLCYGDWQFNICAMNNRSSTLNTWRNLIFPFSFSYSQNAPLLFLGKIFS